MADRVTRRFLIQSSSALALAASNMGLARTPREELARLSASAAVAAMREGDLKAEDYAAALLEQASRLASLNAFRTLRPESVMAAAREADKRRAAGGSLGLMHGLPIPVKDSVNTAALPTSQGTRALRDFVPKRNASVLTPLFAQGAILMGKTNLHELSCGWSSNNLTFGAVRNPYDVNRTPGGSSGGSAAAVASGMAPVAIAEDTYGSIRVPAAFCGLAGLRPTYRRYPVDGIMALGLDNFDQVGPLARHVEDLILFDSVVTGEHEVVRPASLQGVRIGVSPQFLSMGMDAECERLLDDALRKLKDAGATLIQAELPKSIQEASTVVRSILGFELLESMAKFLKEHDTGITLEQMLSQVGANLAPLIAGSRNPGEPPVYRALLTQRAEIQTATRDYFGRNNLQVLAFPPTLMPAFPQGEAGSVAIGGRQVELFTAIGRNIGLGSCASLACLVLPIGMTTGGLPVAIEFDAPSGTDRRLLALGLSLERVLGPIAPPRMRESLPPL